MSFRNTQLIATAAKLNVAADLKDDARSARQLSELVKANPNTLYRLLRALASMGIFEETPDGNFANTAASELLLDDAPGSLRNIAILYGEGWLWNAYGQLSYSIESGKQPFQHVHGQTLYDYLKQDEPAATVFNKAMSAFSETEASAILKAYNFSLKNTVVDVGGGEGSLVAALVQANPGLSGIVFDLSPSAHSETTSTPKKDSPNITYSYGDFFDEVPSGGDLYLVKSVLHNWDNASCIRILKNCRKAMTSNSGLLVLERIVPTGNEKSDAKLFDINMLVMTGGMERTQDEYRKLFAAAGFTLTKCVSTQSSLSILEGLPVSVQTTQS